MIFPKVIMVPKDEFKVVTNVYADDMSTWRVNGSNESTPKQMNHVNDSEVNTRYQFVREEMYPSMF